MNEFCLQMQERICRLITDDKIKESYRQQCRCICPASCIRGYDIVIEAPEHMMPAAEAVLMKAAVMSVKEPAFDKRISTEKESAVCFTASSQYKIKLIKGILSMGGLLIRETGSVLTFRYQEVEIVFAEALCGGVCAERASYSEDMLLGKLLGLSDILKQSQYDAINFSPQVSITLEGKMRHQFLFSYLHELAVYTAEYRDCIDWGSIFAVLAHMRLSIVWIVLIKLFNYIYNAIPAERLLDLIEHMAVHDEGIPSDEIWFCVDKYCSAREILNNDYRRLYEACLTTENSTGMRLLYGEKPYELSFDEADLTYTLDHNTKNPYGSPVFCGDALDHSDDLSVRWGVWTCHDKLCFLLKIHNTAITPAAPPERIYHNCHSLIAVSGSDGISHKLTELLIRPSFDENGEILLELSDSTEQDLSLREHLTYEYRREGGFIYITLSLDNAYLHVSDRFGFDLLTCALWQKQGGGICMRKTLAWAGCQRLWRDLRALAPFERMKSKHK